jgi:hypothetical protein
VASIIQEFDNEQLKQDCNKLHNVVDLRKENINNKYTKKVNCFIEEYQDKYGELDMETINVLYKFVGSLGK